MPMTYSPLKKAQVKKSLLQGKSARQALRDAKYSNGHIRRSTKNKIVRDSIAEIQADFQLSMITPEYVLSHVNAIMQNPRVNHSDKLRANELLGKYLALWKDKNINENINPDKIIISYHKDNAPERILERNRPSPDGVLCSPDGNNPDKCLNSNPVNNKTKVSNMDKIQPVENTTVTPTSL